MDYCEPEEIVQPYAKESPSHARFFMTKRDNSGELEDVKEARRREERARTAQLIQQAIEDEETVETYSDDLIEAKFFSKYLERTIKPTKSEGSIYRKLSFTSSEPPPVKSFSASACPSLKSHCRNKPDLGKMVEAAHHPAYDEAYLRPFTFAAQEDTYFDDCMYGSFDDDEDHVFAFKLNAKSAETIDTIITDRPTSAMDSDVVIVPPKKSSAELVGCKINKKKWRWMDLFSFARCTTI